MIDRAVCTWLSSGSTWQAAFWPHADIHAWSWRAAVALLRKQFSEVVLYTDAAGARLFADFGFTDIEVIFDDAYPKTFWGVAKLDTQSRQTVPYVHVDGDFFLFSFPDEYRNAERITQCKEHKVETYNAFYQFLRSRKLVPAFQSEQVYNVGIVGGNDVRGLAKYASEGLAGARAALAFDPSVAVQLGLNYHFEQAEIVRHFPTKKMTFMGTPFQFYGNEKYLHAVRSLRGDLLYLIAPYLRKAEQLSGVYMADWCSKEAVFSYIYGAKVWSGSESLSGHGSSKSTTRPVVAWLPELLKSLNVRTLLDVGCGDLNWLQPRNLPCDYVGVDVVPTLIKAHTASHEGYNRARFLTLDASKEALPKADCVLLRDVLIHLSLEDGLRIIESARKAGATHIIASTYPGFDNSAPLRTGGFRPVDLSAAPFNLGTPQSTCEQPEIDHAPLMAAWRL